jgi:hypothetical protein
MAERPERPIERVREIARSRVALAEEKWARRVRAARAKWLEMVKKADSLDAYVKGIAEFTGLPESVIRASFPARNWAEFQANAEKYVDIWISRVEAAARAKKWSAGYIEAFRTPG